MKNNNRTLWTEGMFLGPQHFQQNDRFILSSLSGLHKLQGDFNYGFIDCQIDESALAEGKFSLSSVKGVFSDGTPFSLPENGDLPDPINISIDVNNKIVALAIPFEKQNSKDVAEHKSADNFSRYLLEDQLLHDRHTPDSDREESVFTGGLWTRLILEDAGDNAYYTIPIARIIERRDNDTIVLDKSFYPCAASISASTQLIRSSKEIHGLLHQRSRELANTLGRPSASDTSQLVQLLLLQIMNRYEPLFAHISSAKNDHPEILFRELLKLAGELCTITSNERISPTFPEYIHRNQYTSFFPVLESIRTSLNWIPDSTTQSFAVNHVRAGAYTATVNDLLLFESSRFILAVKANVPEKELQQSFSRKTIISSKMRLRDLVESQANGIELTPLTTVPNSIPMYESYVYFELNKNQQLWKEIALSGEIALHVAGTFTGLSMQLWTIPS